MLTQRDWYLRWWISLARNVHSPREKSPLNLPGQGLLSGVAQFARGRRRRWRGLDQDYSGSCRAAHHQGDPPLSWREACRNKGERFGKSVMAG